MSKKENALAIETMEPMIVLSASLGCGVDLAEMLGAGGCDDANVTKAGCETSPPPGCEPAKNVSLSPSCDPLQPTLPSEVCPPVTAKPPICAEPEIKPEPCFKSTFSISCCDTKTQTDTSSCAPPDNPPTDCTPQEKASAGRPACGPPVEKPECPTIPGGESGKPSGNEQLDESNCKPSHEAGGTKGSGNGCDSGISNKPSDSGDCGSGKPVYVGKPVTPPADSEPKPTIPVNTNPDSGNTNDGGSQNDGGTDDIGDTKPVDPISDLEKPRHDGRFNNLENPEFGAADTPLLRLSDADPTRLTDDGLPSPREVSNIVNSFEGTEPNKRGLSDFIWVWGQFIDHDITLTEANSGEAANIPVPKGDPFFDPTGTGEAQIHFERSDYVVDEYGERQHENFITAFVDASQVYGSSDEVSEQLRSHHGGKMRVSEGDLLPFATPDVAASQPNFLAGDVRAGENVALSSMHTLFVREHNRLAEIIAQTEYAGYDLTDKAVDEAIYERARSIVAAEMQHITYNEFLPAMLGEHAISDYHGYDPTVDPGIATEFSTAAFRVGHTMLSSELQRLDEYGETIDLGALPLRDAFFNSQKLMETGVDPVLRGLAAQTAQEVDPYLVDDVRNFLFGHPGAGGFDLASLNIQRGRDHELPSYNEVREAIGLERVTSFADISSDPETVENLKKAYGDVDKIDLWVGGLAEDHVKGSSLGETFQCIISDQFERLRDGDRFWYENRLSAQDIAYVENLSLSDIIEMNSGAKLQDNVFFVEQSNGYFA